MFAGKYLNKSQSWLLQRLNGSVVKGKPRVLKNDECQMIADGSKQLAATINEYALEIENANNDNLGFDE